MSSGPETRFIASVHRLLPPATEFHREKMANPYRGGTADCWYSGKARDLWIEWKYVELPKFDDTVVDLTAGKKPPLSALQQEWIRNRLFENRNVWVIVGNKDGGVLHTDLGWAEPYPASRLRAWTQTKAELARRILDHCNA